MSGTTRTILWHYGGAVVITALAAVLRWLLDPLLGDHFPLVTLFAGVVVVARYAGRGPALLSLIGGGLAAAYFFLRPRHSFAVGRTEDRAGLALYAALGITSIGLFETLSNALRRAEDKERRLEKEVVARRATVQGLAEEGERLRTTLASIGDAVITTDAAGRITGLNPVAEALTGWTRPEATGQPLDVVFHIVNEDTRQAVQHPATRALSEGVVVGLANHTVLIARDGTERPIDDSAAPIRSEAGRVVGCVLVFRDISERRRLEQENASRLRAARLLAAIVESSDDAIVSKSLDGVIQTWNAAAERLFGYPAEHAVGRHISLVIPADRTAEEDHILATLKAGRRIEHFDTVRVRSDGRLVQVSLTISPVRDEAGRVVGASKIVRDIATGIREVTQWRRDRFTVEYPCHSPTEHRWFVMQATRFQSPGPVRVVVAHVNVTERRRAEDALRDADRRKDEFLATLAGEVGLDRAAFETALRNRVYREAHREALRHAYEEAGVTGVPLFVIGDRVLTGLQDRETLETAIEQVLSADREQ